jgi:MFS family permease
MWAVSGLASGIPGRRRSLTPDLNPWHNGPFPTFFMDSSPSPSRARHGVIVFAVLLGIIHYIDRVCISKARPHIQADLSLDDTQMGLVFSAFTLAYALFEIPGGWLGDKWGPRRVLLRIVMFWSFFTAATGYAWNQASMMVCRFLFGAGEAGGFPNIAKMFSVWLPQREHGMAQGITWLAARWGGAFTPLLVVWVLGLVSWRMTFVIFACLGVVWAVCFAMWFRDDPKNHPQVNAGELALLEEARQNLGTGHAKIPWGRLLSTRSVLLLWVYYFCLSYVWYFYITWLPKFMEAKDGLQMDIAATSSSILNGLPLFFGAAEESRLCDAGARHLRLLQRSLHAGSLGCLHGHRRQARGVRLRQHEHDRQSRRSPRWRGRAMVDAVDGLRLGWCAVCGGRDLPHLRRVLALHRLGSAARIVMKGRLLIPAHRVMAASQQRFETRHAFARRLHHS